MPQETPSPAVKRYWPLISLLELFCNSRQYIKLLPVDVVRRLLLVVRGNISYCSHMRRLDGWGHLLKIACSAWASLLSDVSSLQALRLLNELEADWSENDQPQEPCMRQS